MMVRDLKFCLSRLPRMGNLNRSRMMILVQPAMINQLNGTACWPFTVIAKSGVGNPAMLVQSSAKTVAL